MGANKTKKEKKIQKNVKKNVVAFLLVFLLLSYWCYFLHKLRDLISPLWVIFFVDYNNIDFSVNYIHSEILGYVLGTCQ